MFQLISSPHQTHHLLSPLPPATVCTFQGSTSKGCVDMYLHHRPPHDFTTSSPNPPPSLLLNPATFYTEETHARTLDWRRHFHRVVLIFVAADGHYFKDDCWRPKCLRCSGNLTDETPIQTLRWLMWTTFDRQGVFVQRTWFRMSANKGTRNIFCGGDRSGW